MLLNIVRLDPVISSEFIGYCVGLQEADAAETAEVLHACGAKDVVRLDVADFSENADLTNAGCAVLPLPATPEEARRLFECLARRGSPLSLVFLADQVDLRTVVAAVRCGAADILSWPSETERLESVVIAAVRQSAEKQERQAAAAAARKKLEQLNRGERDVLEEMLAGRVNKSVASRLGIALRTVENRRKHIFTKLGTRSLAEIVRLVQQNDAAMSGSGMIPQLPSSSDSDGSPRAAG